MYKRQALYTGVSARAGTTPPDGAFVAGYQAVMLLLAAVCLAAIAMLALSERHRWSRRPA